MNLECPRCGTPVPPAPEGAKEPGICSHCGLRFTERPAFKPSTIIRDYFQELWRIIFHPTEYFRNMPGGLRSGMGRALGFALVTHWLGAVMAYFWGAVSGGLGRKLSSHFEVMFGDSIHRLGGEAANYPELRERLMEWFWGMGSVIADPFLTLATIFFTSAFVYIGARILVPSDRTAVPDITFESAVKIVSYGMSPAIFAVVPGLGSVAAPIATAIVTIIGAREVYRIGTGRAIIVALFPKILFFGILLMVVAAILAFFFRFLIGFH